MKRAITAILVIFTFFEGVYALAVYQPQNLGYGTLIISSGTVTDIQNSTAAAGTQRFCFNCQASGNAGTPCYSTGAVNWGSFVLSSGTRCQ